jgi:hypothetical protein
MWKRKRKVERLPWYRDRNYKGDMSEDQKRQLDAFRMQPKHPAAEEDDLPAEVQNYINSIAERLLESGLWQRFSTSTTKAARPSFSVHRAFGHMHL